MTDNRLHLPMIGNSPRLEIEYVPVTALKLNISNPRQHSEKQITNLARNIDNVGFVVPCLVDDENHVLAGNARIEAAARVAFLSAFLGHVRAVAEEGAICFVFMDWRHVGELLAAAKAFTLQNVCVWVKNNSGMGSLYRSQHELVFAFKCGDANHVNNVQLGKYGRNRSNVWEYRGLNSFGTGRDELLKSHPTVKPVALVADAIKDCSHRGDHILDPFAGSGTTLIAAEKTKRRSALIEIDPLYVDAIVRRWEAFAGEQAVCAASGMTFAQREAYRDTDATQGSAS